MCSVQFANDDVLVRVTVGRDAGGLGLAYVVEVLDGPDTVMDAAGLAPQALSWWHVLAACSNSVRALCTLRMDTESGWNTEAAYDELMAAGL